MRPLHGMNRIIRRSIGGPCNRAEGLDDCRLGWIKSRGAPFDTSDLLTQTLNHLDVALRFDAITNITVTHDFAANSGRRTNHLLRHDVSLKYDGTTDRSNVRYLFYIHPLESSTKKNKPGPGQDQNCAQHSTNARPGCLGRASSTIR